MPHLVTITAMHRIMVAAALIASHAVGQDPPAKQEAKEILLQVRWRVEQSTVKIVMVTEARFVGIVSTYQTKVEYDEHVLEVGAGLRRKVRRTYKKYVEEASIRSQRVSINGKDVLC